MPVLQNDFERIETGALFTGCEQHDGIKLHKGALFTGSRLTASREQQGSWCVSSGVRALLCVAGVRLRAAGAGTTAGYEARRLSAEHQQRQADAGAQAGLLNVSRPQVISGLRSEALALVFDLLRSGSEMMLVIPLSSGHVRCLLLGPRVRRPQPAVCRTTVCPRRGSPNPWACLRLQGEADVVRQNPSMQDIPL